MREQRLYIGGEWVDGVTTSEVVHRWTGDTIGVVHRADAVWARAAVDAASAALKVGMPLTERARVLKATADAVRRRRTEFAECISAEVGKPITASFMEVDRAVSVLELSAVEAVRPPSETVAMDAAPGGEGTIGFTRPRPKGIVAAITPFNFPLNLVVHKVGPAIAAGCPIVLKPSDKTKLTAGLLVECLVEAGIPRGMINLVTGTASEVVGEWLADDRVAVVTFTGSPDVGWKLKQQSPRKLHILELGSNTAIYIAADADLVKAADDCARGALANSGQACISLQRIYVDASIEKEFAALLAERFAATKVGDPRDADTIVGPLVADGEVERIESWIGQAVAAGATVLAGGDSPRTGVLSPTLLAGVTDDDAVMRDEIFGPVASVLAVADVAEAIRRINDSRFGLNAAIYTESLSAAMAFSESVECGSVLVNIPPSFRADHMPYGGVKDSGQGREGVRYAVAELTEQTLIVLAPGKQLL